MKRLLLPTFLALVGISGAFAQIHVGPVVGPQVSWVHFDDKGSQARYSQRVIPGFHAGFGLSFRVHNRFFLHSSFLYSTKGKNLTGKDDALLKARTNYHYIDIPMAYTVEFKQSIGKTKAYKWFFGLGPHVSYWLGGRGTLANTQLSEVLVDKIEYKTVFNREEGAYGDNEMNVNDANRLQLGLNIAAGMVFEPLGYQKIMVTFRYESGHSFLSPIEKGTFTLTNEYEDDLRVRMQGFRMTFSYLIDLRNEDAKKGKSTINKKRLR